MMPAMLDYVLENFYPDIAQLQTDNKFELMYEEIVMRTIKLAARW